MENIAVDMTQDPLFNIDLTLTPEEILNSFDAEELIKNHICNKDSDSYEREVLFKTDKIEIVFCHWKSKDGSEPHFHPKTGCWFKCLQGKLTEVRCRDEHKKVLSAGENSYIDDTFGSHKISNLSSDCTFTLHFYKKQ